MTRSTPHRTLSLPLLLTLAVTAGTTATVTAQQDELFDSNGTKIRYVTEGTGEAIVLLHGWMGDSSFWGRDLRGETRLKTMPGFQAIAIDLRGHGQSDKPHDPAQYGPELAADVVRLLDHLHIEKAHLVGYSSGAFVVGKVAAMHPQRVLSIVYAGQAPLLVPPTPAIEAGAEPVPAAKEPSSEVELLAQAVASGRDLGEYLIAITPPDKPKLTPAQAKALAKLLYGGKDLQAAVACGRSFPQLAVTVADLQRCTAPTMFLHGSEESASVQAAVTAARARLAHGTIELVPGGDHMTTPAKPEFGQKLKDFLRANRQTPVGK